MGVSYVYDGAGFLVGVYEGDSTPDNSTTLLPIYSGDRTPQFLNGAWVNQTVSPAADQVTHVTRLEFKALFTGPERIAIKKARAIDDLVEDFFSMVEDPDATGVDLTLQSTLDALLHLEGLEILTEARRLQILAGTPQ